MNTWERKTLLVMAKAKSPMSCAEVVEADPAIPRAECSRALYQLRMQSLIDRCQEADKSLNRPAAYEITPDGIQECEKLVKDSAAIVNALRKSLPTEEVADDDPVTVEIRKLLAPEQEAPPVPDRSITELLATAEDTFVIEIAARDPQAATVIQDASLHANRLRAIASWQACEGDIRAWLLHLAGLLDTHEESIEKSHRHSESKHSRQSRE